MTSNTKKFRDKIHELIRAINPTIIFFAVVVLLFGFLGLMGYLNRPISDDYAFSQLSSGSSPFHTAIEGFTTGNGRLGQYFLFALYFVIFGLDRAVKIAPIVNTIVLASVLTVLTYMIMTRIRPKAENMLSSITLGSLAAITMVYSTKSIFDSSLWLDSSVSYIPSLIFLVLDITLFLGIYLSKSKAFIKQIAAFSVVVLIGQQFSEPTDVILIALFFLWAGYFIFKRNRKMIITSLCGLGSALLGLLTIYVSPGSQSRRVNYHSNVDFHSMFIGSLKHFEVVFNLIFSWRLALFLMLGTLIWSLMKDIRLSKKQMILLLAACLLMVFIPYYILFVVSEYSLPGYIALRTYQVPTALAGVGISGVITLLLYYAGEKVQVIKTASWLTIILLIVVLVGLCKVYRPLARIVKAEAVRSIQYDYREQSIRMQLASGSDTIRIFPAPVLLTDAEPAEILYYNEANQIDWYKETFLHYYHLEGKTIEIVNRQVSPYCLSQQALPWWNIQSCEMLDAAGL